MFNNLISTYQSILHGEIVFACFLLFILFIGNFLTEGKMKQTMSVQAVMTIITFMVLFGIPCIFIIFSKAQAIVIIVSLAILLGFLLILLGKTKSKEA